MVLLSMIALILEKSSCFEILVVGLLFMIDTRIETLLNNYMKENNIDLKSVAIKKCIEEATNKEDLRMILVDIDKKINRLLHRENIDKKLLEQLFCNMGFPINEKIKDDTCLKEFYKINEEYSGRFGL